VEACSGVVEGYLGVVVGTLLSTAQWGTVPDWLM
jgi:hypothetical protein